MLLDIIIVIFNAMIIILFRYTGELTVYNPVRKICNLKKTYPMSQKTMVLGFVTFK